MMNFLCSVIVFTPGVAMIPPHFPPLSPLRWSLFLER